MQFFLANITHFVNGLQDAKILKPDDAKTMVRVASEKSDGGRVPLHRIMLANIFEYNPKLIKIFEGELAWNNGQLRILREGQQAYVILKK